MKEVGVVIVTYNRLQLLKDAIESVRNQTYQNFDIIIVNNGSTDGTTEWLDKQKDLKTITQENSGGAGGFHTGMKYTASHGYTYCWVMDDDVFCYPDALEELLYAYSRKPRIGYVCSQVAGINGQPMNTPMVDCRVTENGFSEYYDLIDYSMIKIRYSTFVSFFISTKVIKEIGLPYKDFFIWFDDSEYSCRVSNQYVCYMACKSKVIHKRESQSELSIDMEHDSKRISCFYYYFRNNWFLRFRAKSKYKKSLFAFKQICKATIHRYLRGDRLRAKVIIKAAIDFVRFNPQIEYVREFPNSGRQKNKIQQ